MRNGAPWIGALGFDERRLLQGGVESNGLCTRNMGGDLDLWMGWGERKVVTRGYMTGERDVLVGSLGW